MKTKSKWLIACTGVCLVSSSAFASIKFGLSASENDYNSLLTPYYEETVPTSRSQTFSDCKHLIGTTVRDQQGQRLGRIHDVVISPRNGEAFAAIGVGGGAYALVPVQALTVTPTTGMFSRTEVTLNCTREKLESGPTVRAGDWAQLDNPTFTQSIYSQYQLQPPAMTGGVGAESLGGSSTGTNTPNQPKP